MRRLEPAIQHQLIEIWVKVLDPVVPSDEDKGVTTGASDQSVPSLATAQGVIACAPIKRIIPTAAL